MDLAELKEMLGPGGAEGFQDETLEKAVEFCSKIKLEPTHCITPGFDVAWDDYPAIDALMANEATLKYGTAYEGVRAYHEPRTVEIFAPWMGKANVYVFLLEGEDKR